MRIFRLQIWIAHAVVATAALGCDFAVSPPATNHAPTLPATTASTTASPSTSSPTLASAVTSTPEASSSQPADFGSTYDLQLLEVPESPFVIEYPAAWEDVTGSDPRCGVVRRCFASDDYVLTFRDLELGDVGGTGMSLAEYMDIVVADFAISIPGYELLTREAIETEAGLPAEVLTFTFQGGQVKGMELWSVHEGVTVVVAYTGLTSQFEAIRPMAEYSFSTLDLQERE